MSNAIASELVNATDEELFILLLTERRDRAARNIDNTPWVNMPSERRMLALCNAALARRIATET